MIPIAAFQVNVSHRHVQENRASEDALMNIAPLFSSAQTLPTTSTPAPAREDVLAQRDKAKLEEARNALRSLSKPPNQAAEDRKAMARQKIEQLKARIRMLQMSAAMDPKGVAKLVAQLARELGAAVKAYASAGGSTADLGAIPTAATPSADAAGADDAATATAEAATAEAATAEAASAETAAEEKAGDEAASASSDQAAAEGQEQAADPYRRLIDEVNARGLEMTRRGSEGEADREFMTQVKGMASALKAIMRQAQNRAKGEGGDVSSADAREGDKAMADLEKEIAEAGKSLNPGVSLVV